MGISCPEDNINIATQEEARLKSIHAGVRIYIGTFQQSGNKVQGELYEYLVNYLSSKQFSTYSDASLNIIMENIKQYIDWQMTPGTFSPAGIVQGKYTAKAVLNLIKKMVKVQEKLEKRDPERWISSLWWPAMVQAYADKSGLLGRVIRKINYYVENKEQQFVRNVHKINEAKTEYIQYSDANRNKIKVSSKFIPKEGISEYEGNRFRDANGNKISIIDGHYTGRYNEEALTSVKVKDDDGNIYDIPIEDLTIESYKGVKENVIKDAIASHYLNNTLSEFLDGQTRYVIPKTNEGISKEDTQQINLALREAYVRAYKYLSKKYDDESISINSIVQTMYNYEGNDGRIHRHNTKESEILYVMVKQGEGNGKEIYHAYPVAIRNKMNKKEKIQFVYEPKSQQDDIVFVKKGDGFDIPLLQEKMGEGYYTASKNEIYGNRINKKLYEGNRPNKQYAHFKRMDRQPNKVIMDGLDNLIAAIRKEYDKDDINSITSKARNAIQGQGKEINMLYAKARKMFGDDGFQKLLDLYDIKNTIWEDEDGNFHTLNESFNVISENYSPHIYHPADYREMLQETIREMEEAAKNPNLTEEESKAIQMKLNNLDRLDEIFVNPQMRTEYKDVYTKYRKTFTNPMRRRKDFNVHKEYMDNTSTAITRNNILIETLKAAIDGKDKWGPRFDTHMDYLTNEFRVTIGDPTYKVKAHKMEIGNSKVKEILEKFGITNLEERDIEKWVKRLNSSVSIYALGWQPALTNRAQVVSTIMNVGYSYWKQAKDMLNSDRPEVRAQAQAIVDNTGVSNFMSMLNDVMFAGGGHVEFEAEGAMSTVGLGLLSLIPALTKGAITGSPMAVAKGIKFGGYPFKSTKEFLDLINLGRDGFINALKNNDGKGPSHLAKLLEAYEANRYEELPAKLKGAKKAIEKIKRRKVSPSQRRSLDELAGLYWDIFANRNSESMERNIARIQKLCVDMKDDAVRSAVTWKLSAAPFGEKILTLSGGEEMGRAESALAHVLYARDNNLLPNIKDPMLSPEAVNFARTAVYSEFFGMSQTWLPQIFRGIGRLGTQYKGYMVQEAMLEYNTIKSFVKGGQVSKRLLDALRIPTSNLNIKLRDTDPEALRVSRLLWMRGGASIITSLITTLPIIREAAKVSGVQPILRGAESPFVAPILRILMRVAFWGIWGAMGGDDDEETLALLEEAGRILLPPSIMIAYGWTTDLFFD